MSALGNPFADMIDAFGVPIPDDRPEEIQLALFEAAARRDDPESPTLESAELVGCVPC